MGRHVSDSVERQWARLGVMLRVEPAARAPDLERLLLATARAMGGNARLWPLTVSWLVEYGSFVARHRLRRLVVSELEPGHRPVLGLVLETAIGLGAPRELRIVLEVCARAVASRPLFDAHRGEPGLESLAEQNASALSRAWGVWAPDVQLKADAIRPAAWLLGRNPEYRARAVRKGDLRCSILEALRHDAGGRARSEAEVARLCGATRTAVRKALAALLKEGEIVIAKVPDNDRDHEVVLRKVA